MISALLSADWYRRAAFDPALSEWFTVELGGVGPSGNGHSYEVYRTGMADVALVIDSRGPAASFRGFTVLFLHPSERERVRDGLRPKRNRLRSWLAKMKRWLLPRARAPKAA